MRTLDQLEGVIIAESYAYSLVLRIREESKGWSLRSTPYSANITKIKTGGYDNGPWPADEGKSVPLGHVLSVMNYEGLSFEDALKTQFSGTFRYFETEALYGELVAAAEERVKKVRRRIEDRLRKTDAREVFQIARSLGVKTSE